MGDAVLLTGASGFVGRSLLDRLRRDGYDVRVAARGRRTLDDGTPVDVDADLGEAFDWRPALAACGTVVHSGGRAHVTRETAANPLVEFRRVNVEGTMRLARHAVEAGVRRFVYLSSIKVNGESTAPGRPFRSDDPADPRGPYGLSKYEAETGLRELGKTTGMEVVVIRPVLVYGPGVKANFRSLMGLVHRGMPLPFGLVDNRRSLVGIDNLTDLVVTCIARPVAAGKVFLVSDGDDLSTPELIRRIARAMGRRPRLLPVPPGLMTLGAAVLGRKEVASRLLGSLQVDIAPTCDTLGWSPPVSVDDGLARTVGDFLAGGRQ